jgi:hypothetical protein
MYNESLSANHSCGLVECSDKVLLGSPTGPTHSSSITWSANLSLFDRLPNWNLHNHIEITSCIHSRQRCANTSWPVYMHAQRHNSVVAINRHKIGTTTRHATATSYGCHTRSPEQLHVLSVHQRWSKHGSHQPHYPSRKCTHCRTTNNAPKAATSEKWLEVATLSAQRSASWTWPLCHPICVFCALVLYSAWTKHPGCQWTQCSALGLVCGRPAQCTT